MIAPDSDLRLDMGDIVCHPWMQGPTASQDQVIAEMERRKAVSKDMADQARAGSARPDDEGKVYRDFVLNGKTYVIDYENADQEGDDKFERLDLRVIADSEMPNKMLTSLKADEVFTRVKEYLLSREIMEDQICITDKEWKLEFEIQKTIKFG